MFKKTLIILSCFIFFLTTFFTNVSNTKAVAPVVPIGVASGAGYAAVGAYVLGGLAVAGGAAALGSEYSDEIKAHATKTWDGFNDIQKEVWTSAINETVKAGNGVLKLNESMINDLQSTANTFSSSLKNIMNELEFRMRGDTIDGLFSRNSSYSYINYYGTENVKVTLGGMSGKIAQWRTITEPSVGIEIALIGPVDNVSKEFFGEDYVLLRNPKNYKDFKAMAMQLGLGYSISYVDSPIPPQDYFNDSVDKAIQGLSGTKEINIPLDQFIAKDTLGNPLSYDGTNVITDTGSVYGGDIVWDYPLPVPVPDVIPTLDSPSVPVGDITVGGTSDLPFVNNPSVPVPEVVPGEYGNILQRIWEGIRALPSQIAEGIGALFVPSVPIATTFEPLVTTFQSKFNTPSDFAFMTEAIQVGGSCSAVQDMYVTIFGKEMKIFDSTFIKNFSVYFKPILSGLFWFLFGFWAFRKANAMASKNGGVNW